jgi:hypothetical protein
MSEFTQVASYYVTRKQPVQYHTMFIGKYEYFPTCRPVVVPFLESSSRRRVEWLTLA